MDSIKDSILTYLYNLNAKWFFAFKKLYLKNYIFFNFKYTYTTMCTL